MVLFLREMQYLAITLALLAGTSVIRPRREIDPGTATGAISVDMWNKKQL